MDDLLAEFLTETNEGLEQLDTQLVEFEKTPNDKELLGHIFRIVHTIKGTSGFLGLSRLEKIAHSGENVLGKYRDGDLEVTPEGVSAILACFDDIKDILEGLEETSSEPEGDDTAIIARLDALITGGAAPAADAQPAAPTETPAAEAQAATSAETQAETPAIPGANEVPQMGDSDDLQAIFDATPGPDEMPTGAAAETATSAESESDGAPDSVADADSGDAESDDEAALQAEAPPSPPATTEKQPEKSKEPATQEKKTGRETSVASQSLRVNVDVLEDLMNMVSELVLTRNQLMQILRHQKDSEFSIPLQRLSHVTTDLQEAVMKTRMQPVGNAWAKLPRIIRDLSIEMDKKIDLQMVGADTELDRQVLDLIKDPLTHMVRNSADHGIEMPEDRLAAGKPEEGKVLLNAFHEGGHIIIEISDDGKGLALDKIKSKAVENGVHTEEELADMSDKQIQQLIFKPGFSTAQKVTSVSGRGVGMDVVKTNIDQIGGNIELSTAEGEGSTFTIKIPLTLAIVSALIVDVSGERFAIPQLNVTELVRVTKDSDHRIEEINATPVLRLRNRLLPLISLSDLLELQGYQPTDEDQAPDGLQDGLHATSQGASSETVAAAAGAPTTGSAQEPKGPPPGLDPFQALDHELSQMEASRQDGNSEDAEGNQTEEASAESTPEAQEPFEQVSEEHSEPQPDTHLDEGSDRITRESVEDRYIIVAKVGTHNYGIIVDDVFDTEEIVVKPVAPILKNLSVFSGNTILGDGSVIMILDPNGIAEASGGAMTEAAAPDEETAGKALVDFDTSSLLLFQAGDGAPKAVPLSLVARLEETLVEDIEHANGRMTIQYRGKLMPLVLYDESQTMPESGRIPLIVFTDEDHSMALVIDRIVDIIEDTVRSDIDSDRENVMGSTVIADKATDIINVSYYMNKAFGDWYARRRNTVEEEDVTRRVLLVDDSNFFLNLIKPMLIVAGFDVTAVNGGQAALDLLEKDEDFEVIVSDIEMPDMNGLELVQKLRSSAVKDKPVIALSSLDEPQDKEKAKSAGFDEYVTKSDRDQLIEVIRACAGRKSENAAPGATESQQAAGGE